MKVFPATNFAIALLALWRGVWLASGVPDTCSQADVAATAASLEVRGKNNSSDGSFSDSPLHDGNVPWRISFASSQEKRDTSEPSSSQNTDSAASQKNVTLRETGIEIWDASLPVWITPGEDGQPGWASWDDNRNGVVDEPGELGAAWSDDFCVVQLPGKPAPPGRIIDRGGYRSLRPSDRQDHDRKNASGDSRSLRYSFDFVGPR
ncbi:hypothetical protein [Rhodopirellula sallentina]|uniref:Secreted protein n=1 Tax=Rhodopirellula sallentina SM41 TaxID=1263870 RepID=M5TZI1_9BACT|nr:hypothetical protein [Rhodopirellula sallentina]EMI54439.1 hypothetical protein RSSM_04150 [Rhodopirellula sallentina SM41]